MESTEPRLVRLATWRDMGGARWSALWSDAVTRPDDGNRAGPFVPDVDRPVKPFLARRAGAGSAHATKVGLRFIRAAIVGGRRSQHYRRSSMSARLPSGTYSERLARASSLRVLPPESCCRVSSRSSRTFPSMSTISTLCSSLLVRRWLCNDSMATLCASMS